MQPATNAKAWREELNEQKVKYPLTLNTSGEEILLRYAIQTMPVVDNRGNWELWGLLLQILMLLLWIWMVMKSSNECSGVGDFVESIPAHRAYPSLGDPLKESEILSDMWKFAEACGIPASNVTRKDDVRAAIQKMLDTPGPCLLEVMVPHQEPVFPMMPSGGVFDDILTEADME
ncbi:hypothetical protein NC651_034101 [Populus alba x Populus x berolinensis]|nr:hypothetical protein NC651_034101 [Populus alba x Populus x berolinensis]